MERGIAHQTDEDFGVGFIGNHIGGAPARDGADVERAGPEERIDGQLDVADGGERVEQLVDGGIAEFGISRVRHFAVRATS